MNEGGRVRRVSRGNHPGNTLCLLIHYLDEINKIKQMNVRRDPCSLFAYLPADSRRACASLDVRVRLCLCAQLG